MITNFTPLTLSPILNPLPPHPQPETLISSLTSFASSSFHKLDLLHQLTRLVKHDSLFRGHHRLKNCLAVLLSWVESHDHDSLRTLSLLLNLSLDDHNKIGLVAKRVVTRLVVIVSGTAVKNPFSDCRALVRKLQRPFMLSASC
ncbi:U-box domain-containing protein 8-like [Arachis ipaensis]|nr:U-box domain-containing protein 8-like [Arachis ipaensis]